MRPQSSRIFASAITFDHFPISEAMWAANWSAALLEASLDASRNAPAGAAEPV